ncbi:MAG TPA: BON domain-containing protein, partial [Rhodospirillales bacterium]|nr:BON domain-containing protein [Rhodospirillales bacterium]
SACDPVSLTVGAAATTGVAAYQERGIRGAAVDTAIEIKIIALWLDTEPNIVAKLSVEVYEGRVLITGIVQGEGMRADAIGLAWKIDGVKDVLNEIIIGEASGLGEIARDTTVTAELKSKLTFDEKVQAVNYAVETVRGTIYLIGIAQDKAELDRVIAQARNISYVKKVISHVRVKTASGN